MCKQRLKSDDFDKDVVRIKNTSRLIKESNLKKVSF